jgi:hypothetical protein
MSSRAAPIQAVVNYQNSQNARNSDSDASIDRARGGIIQITLTIPSKTYPVQGGNGGQVKTDEMDVTFDIDLEQMPLVNVASYKVEEEQIGPDVIKYPNGNITYSETFS